MSRRARRLRWMAAVLLGVPSLGCILPAAPPPSHFSPAPPGAEAPSPVSAQITWSPLRIADADVLVAVAPECSLAAGIQVTGWAGNANAGVWCGQPLERGRLAAYLGGTVGIGDVAGWTSHSGPVWIGGGMWLQWAHTGAPPRGSFVLTGGIEGEDPTRWEKVGHGENIEGMNSYDVYEVPIVWVDGDISHAFPVGDRTGVLLGGALHLGFGPWQWVPMVVPTLSTGVRF